MKRRFAGLTLVALALVGCSKSDTSHASADQPEYSTSGSSGAGRRNSRLEMAEGVAHDVGTLGEGCESGGAPRIDSPDADWSTETITAFEQDDGELVFLPRGGVRVRYPRHWALADGDVFEITYSGEGADAGRVEVGVSYMTTKPAPEGMSPWDVRIQAMEEGLSLEATAATPLPGGRCLVEGQRYAGPAVVLLLPLGGDNTLVVGAEFIYLSDWEREFDEIPAKDRDVGLQILNSVEFLEPLSIPAA